MLCIDCDVSIAPSFVVLCDDSLSVKVSTWNNCFVNALNVRVGQLPSFATEASAFECINAAVTPSSGMRVAA